MNLFVVTCFLLTLSTAGSDRSLIQMYLVRASPSMSESKSGDHSHLITNSLVTLMI